MPPRTAEHCETMCAVRVEEKWKKQQLRLRAAAGDAVEAVDAPPGGSAGEGCYPIALYRASLEAELNKDRAKNEGQKEVKAETGKDRAIAKMRGLVSQNKVRFQQDGFDLDLTYITPQIIAMGFPSTGKEAYYRNPAEEVERFFAQRHPGRFRVYNLCSERQYDQTRFGGRWKRFPFDDHNAPTPLNLIPDFVRDAVDFMHESDDNVVAIHCKAGKGRTGLMISCLLMATDPSLREPSDALRYFGDVRTDDGFGVTIPSQMRYVRYYSELLRNFPNGREPLPSREVKLEAITVTSMIWKKVTAPPEVYFIIYENNVEKFDSRRAPSMVTSKAWVPATGGQQGFYKFRFRSAAAPSGPLLHLRGDARVEAFSKSAVLSDTELFHFWFNSTLCGTGLSMKKTEIDGASKNKKMCDELAIEVAVVPLHVPPPPAAAKAGAAAEAEKKGQTANTGFFSKMFGKK